MTAKYNQRKFKTRITTIFSMEDYIKENKYTVEINLDRINKATEEQKQHFIIWKFDEIKLIHIGLRHFLDKEIDEEDVIRYGTLGETEISLFKHLGTKYASWDIDKRVHGLKMVLGDNIKDYQKKYHREWHKRNYIKVKDKK